MYKAFNTSLSIIVVIIFSTISTNISVAEQLPRNTLDKYPSPVIFLTDKMAEEINNNSLISSKNSCYMKIISEDPGLGTQINSRLIAKINKSEKQHLKSSKVIDILLNDKDDFNNKNKLNDIKDMYGLDACVLIVYDHSITTTVGKNISIDKHDLTIDAIDLLSEKPYSQKEFTLDIYKSEYDRPKAMLNSLLFPGRGQFYNDNDSKGYLFLYGEILSIIGYFAYNNAESQDYQKYLDSTDPAEIERYYNSANDAHRSKINALNLAISIWLGSMIDAYISAGSRIDKIEYNVTDRVTQYGSGPISFNMDGRLSFNYELLHF